MAIIYKLNVLEKLKSAGYSSYRIRKEKIFGEATLTRLRNGDPITFDVLSSICEMLDCQPGDIIEYVSDNEQTAEP